MSTLDWIQSLTLTILGMLRWRSVDVLALGPCVFLTLYPVLLVVSDLDDWLCPFVWEFLEVSGY